jgi:hypothetical protein
VALCRRRFKFWHRYNRDGYGEQPDGRPWDVGFPAAPLTDPLNTGWGSQATIGRIWPIFAGERGEYDLAAGQPAQSSLAAMAAARNDGYLLPEQVWDQFPPSGQSGFAPGTGTFSATPLAWSPHSTSASRGPSQSVIPSSSRRSSHAAISSPVPEAASRTTEQVTADVTAGLSQGRNCLVLTSWTAHLGKLADALRAVGHADGGLAGAGVWWFADRVL